LPPKVFGASVRVVSTLSICRHTLI
jgi:hypothetical protein